MSKASMAHKGIAKTGSHSNHGVSGSWQHTGVSKPPSDPTVSTKHVVGSSKIKPHKAMAMGHKGGY